MAGKEWIDGGGECLATCDGDEGRREEGNGCLARSRLGNKCGE